MKTITQASTLQVVVNQAQTSFVDTSVQAKTTIKFITLHRIQGKLGHTSRIARTTTNSSMSNTCTWSIASQASTRIASTKASTLEVRCHLVSSLHRTCSHLPSQASPELTQTSDLQLKRAAVVSKQVGIKVSFRQTITINFVKVCMLRDQQEANQRIETILLRTLKRSARV